MAPRFLALVALRLALACKEEACGGDEGASLMQLAQPKQQAELVSLASLEGRKSELDFKCIDSTPPFFSAILDGRRLSKASLPVSVGAGSELVILGCNLEVGALGAGPMVNALGEGAKLTVFFYGSFNKKLVGVDYAPFGPLPEETALFVESESARFEATLADAQSRWAARGDGCPEQREDDGPPPPVAAARSARAARSEDDNKGRRSLLEKKREKKETAKKAAVAGPQFLFPPVLVGPVGSGARVEITVKESANVQLKGGSLTVSNGGSSLMGPMLIAQSTLENVVARIKIQESAKVYTDEELTVFDGYLIARVLRAPGFNLADVRVTLEDVANVYAKNVTIVAAVTGTALTATVFAGDDAGISESDAYLSMEDTSNIHARNLRFVGEVGLDAVVMNEIMAFPTTGLHSHVSTVLKETGNAYLKGSILGRGHLVDEVMDLGDFANCNVEADLEASGNAHAASRVSEGDPPWINDVVQLDEATRTDVKGKVEESCNQRVGLLEVVEGTTIGGFTDEIVRVLNDGARLEKGYFDVRVDNSLNWYGEVLDMRTIDTNLLGRAVAIDSTLAEGSSIKVFVSKSANAFGDPESAVCLADSLIDDGTALERVRDSSVSVRVLDSANVEANYFEMAIQDVIDAALDVNALVTDSKLSVKLERCANVKAATVNITDSGELLEQAIQTENLEGAQTSVSVYVSKSANVAAYTLYMAERSFLIDHGATFRFRDSVAKDISVDLSFIGSGSALAKQATLMQRSRLINDVLEIRDMTTDLPDTKLYVKGCGSLAVQKASRLRGSSFLIGNFVEEPGKASTLEKLEVLFSGAAKGPVTFSDTSGNCFDDLVVQPSSCTGPR